MLKLKNYSKLIVYFCGILLFASVFLISAEVFLRKFFLISFGGVDEVSGYILGICISWSLAYVLFEKMHIRIDILYNFLSKRLKIILDILSQFFTLLFIVFLTYFSTIVLFTSIEKNSIANTPLGTPLWIPQIFWVLGFIFFSIVVLILFLKSIISFFKNRSDDDINIKKD